MHQLEHLFKSVLQYMFIVNPKGYNSKGLSAPLHA
jgi:hypothetical protein